MSAHSEERRIAGLLQELIVQSGIPLGTVEEKLGWKPGYLTALLEGREKLSFEDVLAVLPLVNATPADFFAWLYGFETGDAGGRERVISPDVNTDEAWRQGLLDRRFEQSLRVVKDAIARRTAWKEEWGRAKSAAAMETPVTVESPAGD